MSNSKTLDYELHHHCLYDDKPRENMWPYLKWHHSITNYYSGDVFHVTGEGHSDYTFFAVGGASYQIQIEAPPFQFEYERQWWKDHGRGINHICWVVNDARKSMDDLLANGATEVMPFEEFPTYDGFVVHDPEGHWVEIMEFTDEHFRVNELTNQPSAECGLQMLGSALVCKDVDAMVNWYTDVMDMRVVKEYRDKNETVVYMGDKYYDPKNKQSLFILQSARTAKQKKHQKEHGPYISHTVYSAYNVTRAYEDAVWAGFKEVSKPVKDKLTGAVTGYLQDVYGNEIMLRERFTPYRRIASSV